MTLQSSEAAPQGRLTQTAASRATILTPIVAEGARSVKLATAGDVQEFLSQMWGEPAVVVTGWIGGRGYVPYARSESFYVPLEQDACGFTVLLHRQQVDS